MRRTLVYLLVAAGTFGCGCSGRRGGIDRAKPAGVRPPTQLVVFVSPGASPLAADFDAHSLPAISKLAKEMAIPLRVVDVRQGVPNAVAITPLLMYQDHRGRSFYQGRYTGIDRLRNFVRTSRAIPQGEDRNDLSDIPVWSNGRTKIAASVKVADVTGSKPAGYSSAAFGREAREAILSAFAHFRTLSSVALGRSDRVFYLDFNPWLSEGGTLFLSVSLFSQFHCKKTIFSQAGEALQGPWKQRRKLFAQAGRVLEHELQRLLRESKEGDGFDPVSSKTPVVSWTELGLALPAPPPLVAIKQRDQTIPTRWALTAGNDSSESMMTFRFPAPLDGYAGEVSRVLGEIDLSNSRSFVDATGWFEADATSVTMGEEDLDHTLLGSAYLATKRHPTARFQITKVDGEETPVTFGRQARATMNGTFTMKGLSVPLAVPVLVEAVIGSDGAAKLAMMGGFELSLVPYDMEGPDGPAPAKYTLLFDFKLLLQEAR